jgi:hypothetical protein
MFISRKAMQIIGKRIPASWDALIPHSHMPGGLAALNPQALPPDELGAAVARTFIHAAWLAQRQGGGHSNVMDELDDWCPTRPKFPKLPPWWWWPIPPEPEPHPDWFIDFHLGFASALTVARAGMDDATLGKTLDQAIDRSLKVMDSVKG